MAKPVAAIVALYVLLGATPAAMGQTVPGQIPVALATTIKEPRSGRIIVFATRVDPAAKPPASVDSSVFSPGAAAIAARDIWSLSPGAVADIDGETDAVPSAFSKLPAGTYAFQAVLDRNNDYAYSGRGGGDIVSPVVEAKLPGPIPILTLTDTIPESSADSMIAAMPEAQRQAMTAMDATVKAVDFVSPSLSAFWGRPMSIRGFVALPPGYGAKGRTFPTVYSTFGFGANLLAAQSAALAMAKRMADPKGGMPPMIWVYLDESSPRGTHEFADSVNNGPWGHALTAEFLPWIEKQYAMDARPSSRFLTGHSSGGWASLWLQVAYPRVFGGTWPTAPDPSDFHKFIDVDIYAAGANVYRAPDGSAYPLMRDHGRALATFEQFTKNERAIGPVGGQIASFEWVFSPKGPDGRPLPLFDRATGKVDPVAAAYWGEHYDIARIIARDWPRLKPDLDGRIHLYVGGDDTFYLDRSARLLKETLDRLGAKADVTIVPGRTHFDLFRLGDDADGLAKDIAWQMYGVARPSEKRP